jgi:hypothetical protein
LVLVHDFIDWPAVPPGVPFDDVRNLTCRNMVLAKYFSQICRRHSWIPQGKSFAMMIPIVIKLFLDDRNGGATFQ